MKAAYPYEKIIFCDNDWFFMFYNAMEYYVHAMIKHLMKILLKLKKSDWWTELVSICDIYLSDACSRSWSYLKVIIADQGIIYAFL